MSGAAASDVPPRRRVMAIGWDPTKRVALLNPLGVVVRAGGEAVLMVSGRGEWEPVHHRIKVIDLHEQERRSGPNRLVGLPPARLAALAAAGLLLGGRGVVRSLTGLTVVAAVIWLPGNRRAPWLDHWMNTGIYADLRGWTLWRAARRHLATVEPMALDEVVIRNMNCQPVAWQLLRLNPAIRVSSNIDRAALAEFSTARQAWAEQIAARNGRRTLTRSALRRARRLVKRALPAPVTRRLRRGHMSAQVD